MQDARMQMLINALQELPTAVLQDLSQEVDKIELYDNVYDFDEYKNVLSGIIEKHNYHINTYSLRTFLEDFACRYERIEGHSTSKLVTDIENLMTQFKISDNKNEQYCYELYKKLDDRAQRIIEEKRQLPKEKRLREHNVNKGYWELKLQNGQIGPVSG